MPKVIVLDGKRHREIVSGETPEDGDGVPIGGGGGGGAPTNAEYIVGALHGSLSAERLVTNTPTITWNLGTAGQAKADLVVPSQTLDDTLRFDSTNWVRSNFLRNTGAAVLIGTDPGNAGLLRVGGGIRMENANALVWNDNTGATTNQGYLIVGSANTIRFGVSNADRVIMTSTAVQPNTAGTMALGTSSLTWTTVYAGTSVESPLYTRASTGLLEIISPGASGSLQFGTNSTHRMRFTTTGHIEFNVDNTLDIGTSAPDFRPRSVYVGTFVGVGGTPATNTGTTLQVVNSLAPAANGQMVMFERTLTAAGAFFLNSVQSRLRTTHTSGTIDITTGLNGLVEVAGAGGTVTWARGVIGLAAVTAAGTITHGASVYADDPFASGGGTITNAYGFYGEAVNTGTNRYGMYLEDVTGGTITRAVRTGLGLVEFGDTVTIGTDPGNAGLLRVGGGIRMANANALVWNDNGGGTTNQAYLIVGAANHITFGTANADKWRMQNDGHFIAINDNTHDIGTAGALRPRTIYVGTSVEVPTLVVATSVSSPTYTRASTGTLRIQSPGASGLIQFETNGLDRWRINTNGHLEANADNTLDIGGAGATRPRTGYFGTSVIVGTDPGNAGLIRVGGGIRMANANALAWNDNAGATADQAYIITGSANHMTFGTDNTDRWRFELTGHLTAVTDNTLDVGAAGVTRPRTGYFGTSVIIATDPGNTGALRVGGGVRLANAQALVWNDNVAGTTNQAYMIVGSGNHITFGTANADKWRITNTGHFEAQGAFNITATHINLNSLTYTWPAAHGAGNRVLQNNGSGTLSWVVAGGGSATPWTAFSKDLGTGQTSGKFDITGLAGLTPNTVVAVMQTAAPITSKGNSRDEAEMDLITLTGYVVDATTIRAYWRAPGIVVGTYEFAYLVGA